MDTIHLHLLFILGGVFTQIPVRQTKYLNNIVEKNNQCVKKNTKFMQRFKAFHSAQATLSAIELHHMLSKEQHKQFDNQIILEQFYVLAV